MGSLTWTGGAGIWSSSANWAVISGSDAFPGAADDATIAATGNYVVTVSGANAVDHLTLNDTGAQLNITGMLAVSGTVSAPAGTFELPSGGVLIGGTIVAPARAVFSGGTLDGVTWEGTLYAGTMSVRDGLTLLAANGTSPGEMDIHYAANVAFLDSETLTAANVDIVESLSGAYVTTAGTLTIGSSTTINISGFRGGVSFGGPGEFVNDGIIVEAAPPPGLVANQVSFTTNLTNNGTIQDNGSIFYQSLTNNGVLVAGGSDGIAGNLTGTGIVRLSDDLSVTGAM